MAYFAGVGTVIAAVGAGLGGGYLAANISNPPTQGVSKLERRMSAEPITVSAAPAEPVRQVAVTNPTSAPAQEQAQPLPQPQTEAAAPSANAAPSTHNVRAEEKVSSEEKTTNNVAAVRPVQPLQPVKSAEQTEEKTTAPRDALARTGDADIKRADAEKRRTERRQRWASDKRRFQQPREQELEAVEERVREVTEPRRIRIRQEGEPREMFAEPARNETPRIRLFDQDN
jgi:hypothetical protein